MITHRAAIIGFSRRTRFKGLIDPELAIIAGAALLLLLLLTLFFRGGRPWRIPLATIGLLALFTGQRTASPDWWQCPLALAAGGALLFALSSLKQPLVDFFSVGGKRTAIVLLITISLLGGGLRFFQLDRYPITEVTDETLNTMLVLEFYSGRPFEATVQAKEFLFFYLGAQWMKITAPTILSLRYLAAIFGTLTIPLIGLLGWQMFGPAVGVISSLALAISPWHTVSCRIAERQSMAIFFLVLCYVLWWRGIRRSSFGWMTLAGLALGIGFHSWATFKVAPIGVSLMSLHALITLPGRRWRTIIVSLLAVALALAAITSPLLFTDNPQRQFKFMFIGEIGPSKQALDVARIQNNSAKVAFTFAGQGVSDAFFQQTYGSVEAYTAVLAVAALSVCFFRFRRWPEFFLIILFVLHGLPGVLSDVPYQRRLQGLLVPVSLLVGYGLVQIVSAVNSNHRVKPPLLILCAGILGWSGVGMVGMTLQSFRGEFGPVETAIKNVWNDRTVVVNLREVSRYWLDVNSFAATGQRYSFVWSPLPEFLPLIVRDDRDVSVFIRGKDTKNIIPTFRLIYPQMDLNQLLDANQQTAGWEIRIPQWSLVQGRWGMARPPDWNPGSDILFQGSRYLPLDLRPFANKWRDGKMWNLNLDAVFYGNQANYRVDDLGSGLVPIQGIPFFFIPNAAVVLHSVFSQAPERTVKEFTIDLPQPWRVDKVHILGLTSPWSLPDPVPAAQLTVIREDGSQEMFELYSHAYRFEARTMRKTPVEVTLAFQHRDTYMDMAAYDIPPGPPVVSIHVVDVNIQESLLIQGITCQGWPAPDAQPSTALAAPNFDPLASVTGLLPTTMTEAIPDSQ